MNPAPGFAGRLQAIAARSSRKRDLISACVRDEPCPRLRSANASIGYRSSRKRDLRRLLPHSYPTMKNKTTMQLYSIQSNPTHPEPPRYAAAFTGSSRLLGGPGGKGSSTHFLKGRIAFQKRGEASPRRLCAAFDARKRPLSPQADAMQNIATQYFAVSYFPQSSNIRPHLCV